MEVTRGGSVVSLIEGRRSSVEPDGPIGTSRVGLREGSRCAPRVLKGVVGRGWGGGWNAEVKAAAS